MYGTVQERGHNYLAKQLPVRAHSPFLVLTHGPLCVILYILSYGFVIYRMN